MKSQPIINAIRKGNWQVAINEFRDSINQAIDEWEENAPWQAADQALKDWHNNEYEVIYDIQRKRIQELEEQYSKRPYRPRDIYDDLAESARSFPNK